jgi:phosphatidylserine decarboxylase
VRIARDGIVYIAIPAIIAAALFALSHWAVALPFVVVCAFMLYFFRDPYRVPPAEPNVVVAPADGRVTRVAKLGSEPGDTLTLVSIFLSPLDVHINRSPIAGRVTDVSYTKGKFLMATNERASLVNEQNALTIEGDKISVVCKQIAGILARRIVCWKHKDDHVTRGERIGLIKFSSRTDLVLPANVKVTVTEGMKVRGGTTIIGRIQP